MYYSFVRYSIQYFEQEIEIEGRFFESYVEISLQNEFDQQITALTRGVISAEYIAEQYKKDQTINLDFCYIKDFNIDNLKPVQENTDKFIIKKLSANSAVFESNSFINFSNIQLEQNELSFKGAYILKGQFNIKNSILAKEINDFSDIVFNSGAVDFSNTQFGEQTNSFKNSFFKPGFKDFQYANFMSGEANFTNTSFGDGDVSFINANFEDAKPIFKVAVFGKGKVDFHYAHFGKQTISFERVDFGEGSVDFSKVGFGTGKLNFNRSSFIKGDVKFNGIEIESGKITFKRASFLDNYINFSEANCSNTVIIFQTAFLGQSSFNFNQTVAQEISFKSCHLNAYVDFRVKKVNNIDLGGSVVRDLLDFTPYDTNVDIDILDINGMRLIGKIFLDWEKNNVQKLIGAQKESDNIEKAYQYRILKENFHNIGEYDAEDEAYISFKRHESISILEKVKQKTRISSLLGIFSYYFKDLLLDKAGLYATSPIRVLWSMFISYVFFSLILIISSLLQIGDLAGITSHSISAIIGDSFYFSIITYLTVGYGDFCPLGVDKWIAGLEGFTGVFLMSYFTVAFVRKILR